MRGKLPAPAEIGEIIRQQMAIKAARRMKG
jgi:hypothetical protein